MFIQNKFRLKPNLFKLIKIKFYIHIFLNLLQKKKLKVCKSEGPFKVDQLFKIFAEHKYFRENIKPCNNDALQNCRHANVTSCNKWRRAEVLTFKNVAKQKCPLVQKRRRAKVSPCDKVTFRAKVKPFKSVPLWKKFP